jgi:asparagine synthase (glutamine-hydrolysing)
LSWSRNFPELGKWAGRLIGRVARHPKAQGMLRYGGTWPGAYFLRRGLFMPWEIDAERPSWLPSDPEAIIESLQSLDQLLTPDPGGDHARVSVMETGAYMRNQLLRDSDWASMAHSIELRVPLVDSELSRRLAPRMPPARNVPPKLALANAPRQPLPAHIWGRPKTGFETPVSIWTKDASAARYGSEPWARRWARTIVASQPT